MEYVPRDLSQSVVIGEEEEQCREGGGATEEKKEGAKTLMLGDFYIKIGCCDAKYRI